MAEPESEEMKIRFKILRSGGSGGGEEAGDGESSHWGPSLRERRVEAHVSGPMALVVRCFWRAAKEPWESQERALRNDALGK